MSTIEKTYKTSEVAKIIGIHPNTVRMYEDLELISKPIRKDNGYRVFTDLHIYQFKLARKVFEVEVLQNGLNHEKEFNLKRKEVSELLGITMDTIRNWEMNGLVNVKRQENGYRIYTYKDIQRLKVIRSLKCGNYSLSAILRMLNKLSENNEADINEILNSPDENEDIISVCDKLINSLNLAVQNAEEILEMLYKMKRKYSNSPL